jgi:hypothetical protein
VSGEDEVATPLQAELPPNVSRKRRKLVLLLGAVLAAVLIAVAHISGVAPLYAACPDPFEPKVVFSVVDNGFTHPSIHCGSVEIAASGRMAVRLLSRDIICDRIAASRADELIQIFRELSRLSPPPFGGHQLSFAMLGAGTDIRTRFPLNRDKPEMPDSVVRSLVGEMEGYYKRHDTYMCKVSTPLGGSHPTTLERVPRAWVRPGFSAGAESP